MESQRTLLHSPPAWESTTADETLGGRISPAVARARPAAEPGTGQSVLGRYELLERLGRGGFGEVWRARDEHLHREVAVKRIWLGPDGDSERASREALAAARLSHPAIVALYEARAVEDAFYLISELIDGDTLAKLISERRPADGEVLDIALALAHALAHAHARGVIHRDIKPQNVLVPRSPQSSASAAKLTDFGGAVLAGEDALTRTGDVLGTLAYMAPEQSEGLEVGEEADLYSLALVLYEALCGVNPVRGPSPAATARRIGRRLEPLERRRTELPRGLTRALDTALEPAPGERGTLGELTLALQVAHEQLHGSPPRTPRPRHRLQSIARAPAHAPATRSAPPPIEPEAEEQPAEARQGDEGQPSARPARGALPRPVWIALVCATVIWLAASGRPGLALLAIAAALPLLALPIGPRARSATPAWLACALAPMLGVVGLAGVFPAIAGQAGRWRERAAAGALGYWWLALAEPLVGRRLWLGPPSGVPAHAAWEGSLGLTATHVIAPTLTLGVLMGAALWGAAAVCLPWLVRGRHALLDALCAVIWTVIIAVAAPAVDAGLAAHATHPSPRGAVLGAVLAALFAVAARALRGPV